MPYTDDLPQPGDVYRHYKGGLYFVLTSSKNEGTAQIRVIYRPLDDQRVKQLPYERSLTEWNERMSVEVDGRAVITNRFTKVIL